MSSGRNGNKPALRLVSFSTNPIRCCRACPRQSSFPLRLIAITAVPVASMIVGVEELKRPFLGHRPRGNIKKRRRSEGVDANEMADKPSTLKSPICSPFSRTDERAETGLTNSSATKGGDNPDPFLLTFNITLHTPTHQDPKISS